MRCIRCRKIWCMSCDNYYHRFAHASCNVYPYKINEPMTETEEFFVRVIDEREKEMKEMYEKIVRLETEVQTLKHITRTYDLEKMIEKFSSFN
jgi:hypothetical protein